MPTEYTACGAVMDLTCFRTKVVIGCDSNNKVLIWDTATNEIMTSNFECPVSQGGSISSAKFQALDDQHLIFTNEETDMGAYRFDLVKGFKKIGDWASAHGTGGLAIANQGYIECTT